MRTGPRERKGGQEGSRCGGDTERREGKGDFLKTGNKRKETRIENWMSDDARIGV